MHLSDLVTNPATGRLSHTKLWANVACASATGLFVYQGVQGTLGADVWLTYLGTLGCYSAARSWIATRRTKGASDA
ncbi:hypothetical protein NH8B_2087 [Pseudogulbenkiania sp. NH8B]|uniref:hypothetical protein n=1 Tax=Pseudogulbenkiania sp. (strain NH8B) TaxID=748280 RepID=UPI0002279B44|nr:hypothetical protein [Pseudogulbenkiania sp. NH8B]BAK76473.1 hypothetical protein NH8B_1656 [Pseudogulbenkiania sp. NH8B]BAK76902.1 hypothetical protein NH8B_2087 [Pseudogulbenkiania sp. NH8B]